MKQIVFRDEAAVVQEFLVPLCDHGCVAAAEVEKALQVEGLFHNDGKVVRRCDIEKVEKEVAPVHMRENLVVIPPLTLAGCRQAG